VVYRVEPARLRNITTLYATAAPSEWQAVTPSRIDVSNPAADYLLGPEWYRIEGNHRWMPRRATLRLASPGHAGAKLHVVGGAGAAASLLAVTVDGVKLPERKLTPGEGFDLTWPVPGAAVGKPAAEIAIEADHTFTPPEDGRPLALVFGVMEIIEPGH
jgi:hypothetical protein